MTSGSLPRRYARAFFEIAEEEGKAPEFGGFLQKFIHALDSAKGTLMALASRSFPRSERQKAVEEIVHQMKLPILFQRFLSFLIHKDRLGLLPDIQREYNRMNDERLGIVRAEIRTPTALETATAGKLEEILSAHLKKKVIASSVIEPEMIGGLIVKIGQTFYDGSIRRDLERIREKMNHEPLS